MRYKKKRIKKDTNAPIVRGREAEEKEKKGNKGW